MKILHTNFHRGWGGQSNRILTECRGLAERGHDVTLAVPAGSKLAERAAEAGLPVFTEAQFHRGFRPVKIGRDVRALRRLLRAEAFDVVHTHGSQDSWAVTYALRFWSGPRPVVLRTKHNVFAIRDHLFNRLLYGRWTDGIVCISDAIVEYCAAKPYLRRENLALIHSAVDADRFAAPRDRSILEEWNIADRYVIGMTGRMRSEKGHLYLLEAMPRVIEHAPDVVLLLAGSGSLEHQLKEKARALKLDRHVVFAGFRTDVPRLLAALDLFVMPSVSEGLGTAILEAAAAGLPIVASDIGGIPDILGRNERGLLVTPADPEALANAILHFYRDGAFAAECGDAARAFVRAQFGEHALVEKTESLYRDFLARRNL